jgi:hypothetical protein
MRRYLLVEMLMMVPTTISDRENILVKKNWYLFEEQKICYSILFNGYLIA